MYHDALRLFHIDIKPANKGHLVFVTDGNVNPIRYPIKMFDFQERPRFYQSLEKSNKFNQPDSDTLEKVNHSKLSLSNNSMLFDLLRLVPNYSKKNNLKKKRHYIKPKRNGQRRF